ncbi:DoxX family membrane protein [Nocardia sp. NPDC005366]|uniref:DoxX family membrane protein n=1 Tax=Nocardia sp. NPDC005366 TaxID=3156878 RepID=UPI0033B36F98
MLLRRLARPLLATAFIADGVDTLIHPQPRAKAAAALVQQGERSLPNNVAAKLPADPGTVVRVNALAQVSAGTLLALGRAPRLSALVLAATVIPATVTEQDFWAETDPDRKIAKRNAFLKDISLLGGLMIASADTAGKPSIGWRGKRAAHSAAAAVSAALPIGASDSSTAAALREQAHEAALKAREIGGVAATRGAELAGSAQAHGAEWVDLAKERAPEVAARVRGSRFAEAAKEHSAEFAGVAKQRGAGFAEVARDRGQELAEVARERGADLAEAARDRGAELAEVARERGAVLAEVARERGAEIAETAKQRAPEIAATARERRALLAEAARERVEARRR